jgi:hypothetical protein
LTTTLTMMAAVRRTNISFKSCTPLLLVVGVVVHRYLFHQLLLPRRPPPRIRCQGVVIESKGSSRPLRRRRMQPQAIVALRRFIASLLNIVIIPRRLSSTFAKDGQMLHWMICLWRGDVVLHHCQEGDE